MKSDAMIATNGKSLIIVLCIALALITSSVYMQVGEHQFLNFDDNTYVTENSHVTGGLTGRNVLWAFTSVEVANWHPITWLSHMADVQLFGMNPRGHHLTNVAIHIATTLSLFLLLVRLTSGLWQSTFVAALFALHPLHVESVAWVAERKDVLSAFFWFLTLHFYAEYVAKRKKSLYLLTLCSFVLGLMSKPMLVTLPLVMLLLDFWPINRYHPKEQAQEGRNQSLLSALVKEKIPFFACSLFSGVVTIYVQWVGEAINNLDEVPLGFRIENTITAYIRYIVKTFWPHDLSIHYPLPVSIPFWQVACSLFALLLVSAATIRCRHHHPNLVVGWFWFLVTLVPVIGILQVGRQSMADRYTYIPLTGLFIMAAWGVPALVKEVPYRQAMLGLLASAAIAASAMASWHQLGYWQDSISLFQHALQVTSDNYVAHNILGNALASKGDQDAAISEYEKALAMRPKYYDAHYNLGNAFANKGDLDAAIKAFRKAITIKPNLFQAHYNLGNILAKTGDMDSAIKEYQAAVTINPNYYDAHNNLGNAFTYKGDLDAAIKEFQEALTISPNNLVAHQNLEIVLEQKRRRGKAGE